VRQQSAMWRDKKRRWAAIGVKHAIWLYSGAPCQIDPKHPSPEDIRQDAAHRAADGVRFEATQGLLVEGKWIYPGQLAGCRCAARAVIPGLDREA
jgi:hypothetical protein